MDRTGAMDRTALVNWLMRNGSGASARAQHIGVAMLDRLPGSAWPAPSNAATGQRVAAITCLWIACKYWSVWHFPVQRAAAVAHVSTDAILDAEIRILQALDFRVAPDPTVLELLEDAVDERGIPRAPSPAEAYLADLSILAAPTRAAAEAAAHIREAAAARAALAPELVELHRRVRAEDSAWEVGWRHRYGSAAVDRLLAQRQAGHRPPAPPPHMGGACRIAIHAMG